MRQQLGRFARAFRRCARLAVWVLAAVAPLGARAQSLNPLLIKGPTTSFASRGGLGSGAGRLMQRIPGDAAAGASLLAGMSFTIQDQFSTRPTLFQAEVLADNGTGRPAFAAPLVVAPVTLPPSTTPAAYSIRLVFNTPLAAPCRENRFLALNLPAMVPGVSDGLYAHISGQLGGQGDELPRGVVDPGVDLAWQEQAGVISEPWGELCFRIAGLYEQPVLQPFANVPAFTSSFGAHGPVAHHKGQAGRWPDVADALGVGRYDDIGWEVIANSLGGGAGTGVLYLAFSNLGSSCLDLAPLGRLWLDPSDPLLLSAGAALTTPGASCVFTWGPLPLTPFLRSTLAGTHLHAQAVILAGGRARLSNAATQFY